MIEIHPVFSECGYNYIAYVSVLLVCILRGFFFINKRLSDLCTCHGHGHVLVHSHS